MVVDDVVGGTVVENDVLEVTVSVEVVAVEMEQNSPSQPSKQLHAPLCSSHRPCPLHVSDENPVGHVTRTLCLDGIDSLGFGTPRTFNVRDDAKVCTRKFSSGRIIVSTVEFEDALLPTRKTASNAEIALQTIFACRETPIVR